MKKLITLLLTALVLSSAMIAQSFIPSWDLEKMQRDKEREAVEFYQRYYDANPDAVTIPEVPTDAMYDLLFQFPPYDTTGTYGVATDGDYIYTARWSESLFHKLDFEGNLVEEFTITGAGEIRDMAYDGEYFYGSPNSTTIYIMDFVNKVLVGTISGPSAVRGMAYDEINDGFWVTNGWDPPIRLISRTGAILQTLNTSASSFAGIGWENVTEGGPYLWGYCQSGAVNNLLVKIDITSGATLETFELNQSVTFGPYGSAGGMEITDKVYPGKWAFFGTAQNDCIWAVELADSAPAEAPAAVTNLTAAGANGALTATLDWINPIVSVNGEPLTELTAVNIYRNDALIHTINNPVIGGAATYTDNAVPEAGNVVYKLVAENSAGEGIPASVTVWVSPDVPAAPGNVLLVAQGNDGFITWDAPDGGLHGGYYTPAGLNYTVKRFPGSVTVAENITVLELLDNTVPGVGNYYYTVTAANDVGVGGTGTSNAALLGAEGLLIFEQFDSGIPAGWEVLGMGGGNWSIASSANAGGTAPELQFGWSPQFVGVSRFASPNINSGEYSALRLKFNQMLNDFSTYTGEFIAVDYSIDNGATWEQIWYHEASSSLGPELTEVYFSVPENTNFRIAFKFDGDAYNFNYWYIDNVVVEPVMGNDLSAIAVTGNVTPSVGDATNYTITFQNAGADPVAGIDYVVRLYKEGGQQVGAMGGVDIAPAEIKTVVIPWTPEEAGAKYLYGYIDYPDDDIPGNNTTGHMNVVVQPEGIIAITIGEGTNMPTFRIPFDFYWRNSIAQTLYFADEIGIGGGVLTAIKYTNNFQTNLPAKEVKVLIGETNEPNLASNWIDPTGFTMVYDGVIDFPSGVNDIMIPLTTPYVYSGGNLVVITNRVYEGDYHSSNDKFYGTEFPGSSRNRYVQSDATIYDPWQVISGTTLSNWAPNSTLFFSTEGLGSLNGTVTAASGGEPIEGVLVKVLGTMAETETNAQGQYNFPALLAGTFDVEFSKYGWETFVDQATIVADQANTFNAKLNSVAMPEIQVNPVALNQTLPVGGQATQDLTISNLGELPLEWAVVAQMPTLSYFVFDVPEGKIEPFEIDVARANAIPGGAPEASTTKDEVILNYDSENDEGIGLTAGGTFYVAVRFPSSMVGQYSGCHLNFVNIYINNVPTSFILKIWDVGTSTSPGKLIHEQPLSVIAESWNLIELSEPVALDGNDLWVGYTVTHPQGEYPAGCDAGPHHPSGDGSWISTDGASWDRLYELGLEYNWNIRAHIAPGIPPWVSIIPKQGTVAGGESETIVVTFGASDLEHGTYNGNIIITSNDPDIPVLNVPVMMNINPYCPKPRDLTATMITPVTFELGWTPESGDSVFNIMVMDEEDNIPGIDEPIQFAYNFQNTTYPANYLESDKDYWFYVQTVCDDLEFIEPKVERFWIEINQYNLLVPANSGGSPIDDEGEDGIWYQSLDPESNLTWYNLWFYNDQLTNKYMQKIKMGFYVQRINANSTARVRYAVNYSTDEWDPLNTGHPMPEDEEFIKRSGAIGPISVTATEQNVQWFEIEFEIPEYSPQWISVDIFGNNIRIPSYQMPAPDNSSLAEWWNENDYGGGIIIHETMPKTKSEWAGPKKFTTLPPCPAPTNIAVSCITHTSALIDWNAGFDESVWNLKFGETGFNPETGGELIPDINTNTYTINELEANTEYDVYIQAVCGEDEFSSWSAKKTFNTLCTPVNIPYVENFDNVTAPAIPDCMTVSDDNADLKLWETSASYPKSEPNSIYPELFIKTEKCGQIYCYYIE